MATPLAHVEQRMDAALDELNGEPRRHFLAVYRRTTGAVNDAIAARRFSDPDWLIAWDEIFAGLYLDALDAWQNCSPVPEPWRLAFGAPAELPVLRHVLMGMNAHINYDLPQALLRAIPEQDWDNAERRALRRLDHERIDAVLSERINAEDAALAASTARSLVDRALTPLNRWASTRFITEARAKVWRNTTVLDRARRQSPETLAAAIANLEQVSAERIADLLRPGQVLLRLARDGFGVLLPDA